MFEGLASLYIAIGLIIGFERLSRATKFDDTSMLCIGVIFIIVFWPVYIIYKLIKRIK